MKILRFVPIRIIQQGFVNYCDLPHKMELEDGLIEHLNFNGKYGASNHKGVCETV